MAVRTTGRSQQRSATTRQALVDAAADVLRRDGFGTATARNIAARAGCNQGLVFYHFGSVADLLLAALDDVSQRRRARFDTALAQVRAPGDVIELAAAVFREDVDNGDAAVLAEMVAGCSSVPGLGPQVKSRMAAWTEFAAAAVGQLFAGSVMEGVVPGAEVAHAIVALYLGLELLTHLDDDRAPALALFDRMRQLAAVAELLFADPEARAGARDRAAAGAGAGTGSGTGVGTRAGTGVDEVGRDGREEQR